MIKAFLRLDPGLGRTALLLRFGIPLVMVFGALSATRGLRPDMEGAADNGTLLSIFTLCIVMLWTSTIGPLGQGRIRVFEYQLSLPISARKLVGIRLVAQLLPGLALAAALLVGLMWSPLPQSIGSRPGLEALAFGVSWVLCVLSLFAWRPRRPSLGSSRVYLVLAVSGYLILGLALFLPRISLALALPGGFLLGLYLWRRVPETMRPVATAADDGPRRAMGQVSGGSQQLWLARQTVLRPRILVTGAAVFFFAMAAQWGLGGTLFQWPLSVFLISTLFRLSSEILRDFGHLPISRRTLTGWILLPSALVVLVGTGVGFSVEGAWSTWDFRRTVRLHFDSSHPEAESLRKNWNVQVPGELLKFHWGKEPLSISAPGGETVSIEPTPLFWGLPLRLVNPYDVVRNTSAELMAWQLSRAVRDAYGIVVSPATLQAKYLTERGFSGTRFHWDFPEAKARAYPVGRLAVGLTLSVLAWVLALVFFTMERLPPRNRSRWRWRIVGCTVFAGLIVGGLCALYCFSWTHGQIYSTLRRSLDGWAQLRITAHPGWSVALALGVLAATWWLGLRRIGSMEAPTHHPALDTEPWSRAGH